MGAVKQWELEKLGLAADLYTALADLVGDVEDLPRTGAFLSWRTSYGHQGHWREERGQLWLGRIVTDPHGEGTVSEQLVLDLDSVGEGEERVGLAHPARYHHRSGEGVVTGYDPDTPGIYAAALVLLSALVEEVREVLPWLGEQEDEDAG